MRRSIDLGRLEQFVAVAREGSLGKAAAALALSQPTLTRNIRSLETEVGARLFDRGPLGTVLTAAGKRFLPRAEALLNDAERALSELAEDGAQAHLRLGVSPNFLFDLLPTAIGRLVAAQPAINVHVAAGTRETIVEDLRRNTIDLGICLIPDFFYTATTELAEIGFEPFGRERILAYVAAGHARAGADTLAAVADCRWAVPHQLSVSYRFESAFYRHHLPVPVQSLNGASLSLLRTAAIEEGLAVLLPERFAAADVAAGTLVALPVAALTFGAIMGIMQRLAGPLASAATDLAMLVRAAAHDRGVAAGP